MNTMEKSIERKTNFLTVLKKAFPYTIPVLAGYLFIGAAFGVMIGEKGYSFWWAALASLMVYAGSGEYVMVTFLFPGVSLLNAFITEIIVNIRHIFYGISLLDEYEKMGKRKFYFVFSLTDETYALYYDVRERVPEDVRREDFYFAIAVLDHSYWILGSIIGAIGISLLPIDSTGVEFAMTALFLTIFTENWLKNDGRSSSAIGVLVAVICLFIFGRDAFLLPAMLLITGILWLLESRRKEEEDAH